MTTQAQLRSVVERVNDLLGGLGEGGGGAATKVVLDRVGQLTSKLRQVEDSLPDATAGEPQVSDINREWTRLAYELENYAELFIRRQEMKASSSASKCCYLRCLYDYLSSERRFLLDCDILDRGADCIKRLTPPYSIDRRLFGVPNAEQQLTWRRYVLEPDPESVLIGLQKNKEHLKDVLLGCESRLLVSAICGMRGIGKTTLAWSAYSDALVMQSFVFRAWVLVGQNYRARDILVTILTSLFPDTNKHTIAALETMALSEMLFKFLKGKRFIIFLDDVWSAAVWDSLRFVFPDDRNGSRIVITTRMESVANYSSSYIMQMMFLTEEESWQLFLTKSGLRNHPATSNPQIEQIGKQIVRSCGGLPLAITLIGQLLSKMNFENWERIVQAMRSGEHGNLTRVLDLSYKDLPFRMKPCFLYMGCFPPDQPILVDKLYLLWMAEGLIFKRKTEAEKCFNELVLRSLVTMVEKEEFLASTRFISCRLHDLIRDLSCYRGKKEDFLATIDFSKDDIISCRRVAVYLNKFEDSNDVNLYMDLHAYIRTILFFDTVEPMSKSIWPSKVADLTNFKNIRVLHFDGVNFQVKRLPRGIENLAFLRYLSFQGCYLEEFPSSFGSFYLLETLDLRIIDSCIMTIPNVLRKLTRLRHLYFPLAFRCHGKDKKLKLDCLQKLEVVENFDTESCDAEDLLQLENLEILTGTVVGSNSDLANIINSIKKMNSTCYSSLVIKRFDSYSKERRSMVAELLQCEVVHALDLEGHLGAFPHDIVYGSNITEMVFNGSEFSEDPMPILGKLPKLKSLVLCNDAVLRSKLVCYESDFPQLKSLKLAALPSLEDWEVESGAMPRLAILTIEQCDQMEMLPSELPGIPTLQKLMIGSMPEKFSVAVRELMKDAVKISITVYEC